MDGAAVAPGLLLHEPQVEGPPQRPPAAHEPVERWGGGRAAQGGQALEAAVERHAQLREVEREAGDELGPQRRHAPVVRGREAREHRGARVHRHVLHRARARHGVQKLGERLVLVDGRGGIACSGWGWG